MNCDEVRTRLTALRDGELPEALAAEVRAHLEGCSSCAQAQAALAAVCDLADAWTTEGGEVWEAVRTQIEPADLPTLLEEMQALRTELRALRAEVAGLRLQLAERAPEIGAPSMLVPYGSAADSPLRLV